MLLYHGGTDIIDKPVVRHSLASRDFGAGFYCTDIRNQAEKWALRQSKLRKQPAVLNMYEFDSEILKTLNSKIFTDYALDWLELIINCRKNNLFKHEFDIVYGKIANDDVGETVQAVVDGLTSLEFALQKLVFMQANNQYCFCNKKALTFIKFIESVNLG